MRAHTLPPREPCATSLESGAVKAELPQQSAAPQECDGRQIDTLLPPYILRPCGAPPLALPTRLQGAAGWPERTPIPSASQCLDWSKRPPEPPSPPLARAHAPHLSGARAGLTSRDLWSEHPSRAESCAVNRAAPSEGAAHLCVAQFRSWSSSAWQISPSSRC